MFNITKKRAPLERRKEGQGKRKKKGRKKKGRKKKGKKKKGRRKEGMLGKKERETE